MMFDFALTYGMKNNDLLKEILTRGVNKDDLLKRIHQNLFLDLFRGFPRRHELIDYNMLGYTIFFNENASCTNASNHIKQWDNNWISKKCVTHEVIAVDRANNYAVIQHNIYQTLICDVCVLGNIFPHFIQTRTGFPIPPVIFCAE